MFRQNGSLTLMALAALAIGIGSNTAIFSVVNAVLLKPPPFPEADRIVVFMNTSPQGQGSAGSPAKFFHWRSQSSVVQDVSAFRTGVVNLTGGDVPEQLRSAQVTKDYFALFGAPVVKGRSFSQEEDLPNGPRVALISEGLWRRRFASDPNILGRTVLLGGAPNSVIGVVGATFDFRDFGPAPDVWVPFQLPQHHRPGPLLPMRRPPEVRRRHRSRARPHRRFLRRVYPAFPTFSRRRRRLQHRNSPRRHGAERA